MKLLRQLFKHEEGVAAVELAIVMPIFALMVCGILETAFIMYASAVMEGATTSSSRLGKTGFTDTSQSRQDLIYNMIKGQCGLLIDINKVSITTMTYSNFDKIGDPEVFTDSNGNGVYNLGETYTDTNGNGQWDSDMGQTGLGGAGDVVLYRVTYPWDVLTPMMKYFFGGGTGTYTLTSSMVVKNEPYDTQ
jgi:hypothetical protein